MGRNTAANMGTAEWGRIYYARTHINSETHWVPPMCGRPTVTHVSSDTRIACILCVEKQLSHTDPLTDVLRNPICFTPSGLLFYEEVCETQVIHFSLSFPMLCNKTCLATKSYMKRNYWFSYTNKIYWFIVSYSKTNFPLPPSLEKKDKENLIWQWSGKLIWYVDKREITKKLEKGQNLFIIEGFF